MTWLYNAGIHAEPSVEGKTIQWFGAQIEERTNGLIKFDYTWSFALTKPGEEIDAIKTGLSPVGQTPITYYPSKLFLSNIAYSVPFVPENLMTQAEVTYGLFEQVPAMREEYEKLGVKLLWTGMSNKWFVEGRVPFTTLADFEGKKVIVSGVYAPRWVEVTGATPLPITLLERATALQTGVVDGSIMDIVVTYPFKLYEFAKHTTYLRLGCWLGTVGMINLETFNDLPKDIQDTLLEVGRETSFYYSQQIDSEFDRVMASMEEAGVTFYTLPDEDRTEWMRMVGNAPARWIKDGEALDLPAREVMETYLRLIEESGYKFPVEWETLPE